MKWQKLGLIFRANNQFKWLSNYSALPIAYNIKDDIFRIFFSTRDDLNRSNGAFLEIDINNPNKILSLSETPVLIPGELGAFDDSGAQICSVLKVKNKVHLYYTGWSLSKTIPFKTFLGLAFFNQHRAAEKYSCAPIMSWKDKEPLSVGYVSVVYHENLYKMWYESNLNWYTASANNEILPEFVIKYATSENGIDWKRENIISLSDEYGQRIISRPSIIIDDDGYKMWYSYKVNFLYRIGYAESSNGIDWIRKDDEVGIDVSTTGWDSEQIEYPFVFDHNAERYMLYNGNGYGKSGFGLARLIK